ncbi:MAG: hypothetical protein ACI9HK_001342 [Pirellulaceae bacterium]|jgi:hypothetical protein
MNDSVVVEAVPIRSWVLFRFPPAEAKVSAAAKYNRMMAGLPLTTYNPTDSSIQSN